MPELDDADDVSDAEPLEAASLPEEDDAGGVYWLNQGMERDA